MWMKSAGFTAIALLVLGSIGLAQAEPPNGGEPSKPGDAKRPPPPAGHAGRAMGRLSDVQTQVDQLDEALSLDDAQKKVIAELFTAQQAKIRAIRDEFRRTPDEMQAWKDIQTEMREAVKNSDRAKIDELKDRSRKLHEERTAKLEPAKALMESAETELHDSILKTLRPDQREKFENVWMERMAPRSFRSGPVRNPRALKSIVDRLNDLSDEQKGSIEMLFKTFQKERDDARKSVDSKEDAARKSDARASMKQDRERLERLFNDVMNLLTPEQKAKVEEQLKGRPARGARGERRNNKAVRSDGETPPPSKGG